MSFSRRRPVQRSGWRHSCSRRPPVRHCTYCPPCDAPYLLNIVYSLLHMASCDVESIVCPALPPGVAWRAPTPVHTDAAGAAATVDVLLPGIEASTLRLQRLGPIKALLKTAGVGPTKH